MSYVSMNSYLYPNSVSAKNNNLLPVNLPNQENYVRQISAQSRYRPNIGGMGGARGGTRGGARIRFERYENGDTQLPESMDVEVGSEPVENKPIQLVWKTGKVSSTYDPKIWGPAFWFSLHTSAVYYPEDASPLVRERMKQRILAIPYEIPCKSCMTHASSFIEDNRDKLDDIVSNRHKLGKFYVDFHNKVNKRFGKPEWTYEQAYARYSGVAEVTYLSSN
jgi:hypothetical protein